jgi:ATP-dependent Clp protease ATP-binding subunit ClpC
VEQQLQELVDRARSGDSEPFEDLVRALEARRPPAETLIAYAHSAEAPLRRAAVVLARNSSEPDVLDALADLAGDPDYRVRRSLAEVIAENMWWPLDAVVRTLLRDEESDVRQAAVRAASGRPVLEIVLVERLGQDTDWTVRQRIARELGKVRSRAVLPALLTAFAEDSDGDVCMACAAAIEDHMARLGGYPADLGRPRYALLREARTRIDRYRGSNYPRLAAWLEERVTTDVDLETLKTYGAILTQDAEAGKLARAYEIDESLEAVSRVLLGEGTRAVVVVGESGCGKTSLIHELVHRLRNHPDGTWYVLRVTPAEFLAGTVYLGEWETKIAKLIEAVSRPRRVVLYVPNLEDLASMGTTSKSDANVATALAPYLERGQIAILGESTVESFRKGLGAVRHLRRLFHAVQMQPAGGQETRAILRGVTNEAAADLSEPLLERLVELSDFYAASTVQPGRSVDLLRRVLAATAERSGPVTERDVLATISISTGIPVDFLDDHVALDRAKVRGFFEGRVMGQPEAIDAVVDLVTLVKAGLTDPNKPFGVLLFVGPTGVGKTELARALAEHLFGDPARMVRLDMSEYATYEAFERLIGHGSQPGLLTALVRERPFVVLLLDEIEKSHLNVFDLCLQIFDAGRLTDTQGRTADFRRAIIIMTSNVGARVQQDAPVGFGRTAPALDPNVTLRELTRSFRPEFLNRIDRIVNFRALTAETAEKIARRELAAVMERGGITRRRLVVDVDPGVLPLLLREGYSPAYGARPLKRTVERLVLLPVARAIASGEVVPGSVLRLVARRGRVEAEVASPEPAEPEPAGPAVETLPVLQRTTRLEEQVARLRDGTGPLAERKSELLARAAAPGFWEDRRAAQVLYDEVYRIDGVLAALDQLGRAVQALRSDLDGRPGGAATRELDRLEERLDALDGQARHVGFLLSSRNPRDLGDAFVVLSLVGTRGQRSGDGTDGSRPPWLDAVACLARMYMDLARRYQLEVEVLDDRRQTDPTEDVIVLQVSGAGSHTLLAGEAGLHQLARRGPGKRTDERRTVDRDVVRVEVLPVPDDANPVGHDAIQVQTRSLANVAGRLLPRPRLEVQLRHEPTLLTLRAWTDRSRAEAIDRLRPLLRARVALAEAAPTEGRPPIVRRYVFGPAPLVRDVRSGRTTGRLHQVLEGQLDMFLAPPAT